MESLDYICVMTGPDKNDFRQVICLTTPHRPGPAWPGKHRRPWRPSLVPRNRYSIAVVPPASRDIPRAQLLFGSGQGTLDSVIGITVSRRTGMMDQDTSRKVHLWHLAHYP